MEKPPSTTHESRLHVLDGLRGLLAVFVVWHHLGLTALKAGLFSPILLWPLWVLGGNGGLAVFFFFVLAGFLMTYLYEEVPNLKTYYLKRFSRIFPLFWAGCILYTLQATVNSPATVYLLVGILSLIFLRIIWTWFLQNSKRQTILYLGIFGFILLSGLVYRFVLRYPPTVLSEMPQAVHALLVGVVNASLTFGLGDYVPIVNFVFWSMGLEILFYLAYPFLNLLFFPKREVSIGYSTKIILQIVTLLFGYYLLIYFISQHLFKLTFFRPETAVYFIIGLFWGLVFKSDALKKTFQRWFGNILVSAAALIGLASILYLNTAYLVFGIPGVNEFNKALIQVIPVALFFGYLLLKPQSTLGKLLQSKPLLWLGQLSYSLYLFHAVVVDIFGDATTGQTNPLIIVIRILAITGASILLAWVVYLLSERYYFSTFQKLIRAHTDKKIWNPSFKKSILVLFISLEVAICFAFAPSFGLTSMVVETPIQNKPTSLERVDITTPLSLSFSAPENGFGVLRLALQSDKTIKLTGQNAKIPTLTYEVSSAGVVIASGALDASQVFTEKNFVEIGIPQQLDSKGREYQVTISKDKAATQELYWAPSESLQLVASPPKSEFLKNPLKLAKLIGQKLVEFISQPELLAATAANLLLTNALYFFRFPWRRKKN